MKLVTILESKFADQQWTLDGETYEGLTWLSNSPKPTEQELDNLWVQVQAEIKAKAQAKIDAKASAMAKLAALGLTVDEVEAAFGLTK
jgi:hypothetical protein